MANTENPNVRETFAVFFEGWLFRQQGFLQQLEAISSENDEVLVRHLIEQVVAHYQQYYTEKFNAASEDVFLFMCPDWLSSLERTLVWISGFKPSMLLKLAESSVGELVPDQVSRIEGMKSETRRLEKKVEEAMALAQESVAAPPICGLMRRYERRVEGEVGQVEAAMGALKATMLRVLEESDVLRVSTMKKVMEILTPLQNVKLLASVAKFQLEVRRCGLVRDAQSKLMKLEV